MSDPHAARYQQRWILVAALLVGGATVFVLPFGRMAPRPAAHLDHATPLAAVTPGAAGAAVRVGAGEDPSSVVVSWSARPASAGPPPESLASAGPVSGGPVVAGTVDVYPARRGAGRPVVSVPVAPGADAVALPGRLPAGTDVAVVRLAAADAMTTLGPSAPFSAPQFPAAEFRTQSSAVPLPCRGAGYGLGRVSIDGYTGFQGSYCLPPAFTSGTGAFCADHGLDYPFGPPVTRGRRAGQAPRPRW